MSYGFLPQEKKNTQAFMDRYRTFGLRYVFCESIITREIDRKFLNYVSNPI